MGKNKVYKKLGITECEVIRMQTWLFSMANETESVSEMIIKTVAHFEGTILHYALYILGNNIGAAQVKEMIGKVHVLNPEEL